MLSVWSRSASPPGARLDEALCNRKAPFLARDVEAGASVPSSCCRGKERLPCSLDQGLDNLEVPALTRD
jgi:hypothetical protein